MIKYKYHPMHMHIHTCHQKGGSMESHIYNAASFGMQYIHFTDHDTRLSKKPNPVDRFDFTTAQAINNDPEGTHGWNPVGNVSMTFEHNSMKIKSEDGSISGVEFYSSGKRHNYSLIADVTLTLKMEFDAIEYGGAAIDIRLSQRPPDHKHAHYVYKFGDIKILKTPHTVIRELEYNEDGIYILNLSKLIGNETEIGGIDNVFDTVSMFVSGESSISVSEMSIKAKYFADELLKRQRDVAEIVGSKYGVKPFVTTEISGAGQHKNCFSTCVPAIDYYKAGYKISEKEAIEHIKSYGGIFAYNHPFENNKYKKMQFTPEEADKEVYLLAADLIASEALGATLLEVGFTEGRGVFTLAHHLRLWDMLSMSGIFITGYGDSDSHFSSQGWLVGNNFASWIAADDKLAFPVEEEAFINSMKAGRVYMGDPVYLKSEISFKCDDEEMGSVFYGIREHTVSLRISESESPMEIRIVFNGSVVKTLSVDPGSALNYSMNVKPSGTVSFVRIEMYNSDGRCIGLTNPIYFVDPQRFSGEIPTERIVACKEKRVIGEYIPEIVIPETVNDIKGTKVLHIGDTYSYHYPYYAKLIDMVKPDIIIHTGDMADEVKVGRIKGTRNDYISKIKVIAEIMSNSGAELYVVPGNNDLPDEIVRILPEAKMCKLDEVITIDGVECRVGHQVQRITFDKKWHFYGHGFTGEEWSHDMNKPGGLCRFNAYRGATVCSLAENYFELIEIPGE